MNAILHAPKAILNNNYQVTTRYIPVFSSNDEKQLEKKAQIKPNKSHSNSFAKKAAIFSAFTLGILASDLFIAKGKMISSMTKGKVSFLKTMSNDIDNFILKDPATRNRLEAFICAPGLHALWSHRIAHKLYNLNVPVIPRIISNVSRFFTGIEIHPGAIIGPGAFFDHTGLIVGETAQVGKGFSSIGRAVLGSNGKGGFFRHPIIGDNVTMGMDSKVIGRVTVGDNVFIGSDTLVLHNVPSGVTVAGNPACIIKVDGKKLDKPIKLTGDSVTEITKYRENKV